MVDLVEAGGRPLEMGCFFLGEILTTLEEGGVWQLRHITEENNTTILEEGDNIGSKLHCESPVNQFEIA